MIKTISIIGGKGKMGSVFASAFKDKEYDVIVSSRSTDIKPTDAVKQADLIIISVPINVTEQVIREISPLVRKEAILSDFTSIKIKPSKLMKKYSKANIVSSHPLFGPGVDLNGQTIALCNVRGSRLNELKQLYQSIGLKVVEMTPEEHDRQMAIIQCLNQFTNLGFASSLLNEKFDLDKKEMFTPAFNLKLAVTGRTLSQSPDLYPEILIQNPYTKKIISTYLKCLKEIQLLIKKKDEKALETKVRQLQDYFGSLAEQSRNITNKILNSEKENTQ